MKRSRHGLFRTGENMKQNLGTQNALYPMPVVIVGCEAEGKSNFNTIAHVGIIVNDMGSSLSYIDIAVSACFKYLVAASVEGEYLAAVGTGVTLGYEQLRDTVAVNIVQLKS